MYESMNKLQDLKKKINFCDLVCIFIGILMVLLFFIKFELVFLIILVDFLLAYIIAFIQKQKKSYEFKFKVVYKNEFVQGELEKHFQEVDYDWRGNMSGGSVAESGLISVGNSVTGEDHITALYKDCKFEQSDIRIFDQGDKKYERYGNRVKRVQSDPGKGLMFVGRLIKVWNIKKDVFSVQLYTKGFRYRGKPVEGYEMHKVSLEDMTFNSTFDIYTANEQDAFYLLTPAYMEKILEIQRKYKNIAFHFSDGFLYIAINQDMNAFDVDYKQDIDYFTLRDKVDEDIKVIKDIMDALK